MTPAEARAPRIEIVADAAGVARRGAEIVVARLGEAIAARGRARIALSGGATPMALYSLLAAERRGAIDWSRVAFFWGDERCVPAHDPESNFGAAMRAGVGLLGTPRDRLFGWETELDPDAAARRYETALRRELDPEPESAPRFDLALLGLGADGHTASLFPGTLALEEWTRLAVANPVPQLGTTRLTMTVPVFDAARCVLFLVAGAAKAEIVARVLASPPAPELPATLVRPRDGELLFLVDRAASERIGGTPPAGGVER